MLPSRPRSRRSEGVYVRPGTNRSASKSGAGFRFGTLYGNGYGLLLSSEGNCEGLEHASQLSGSQGDPLVMTL